MPSTPPLCLTLHPHPGTPPHWGQWVHALRVHIQPGAGAWRLHYQLQADTPRLRLPAPSAQPGPRDGLWQQSCFEAFIGTAPSPSAAPLTAYHEFNFSPAGHWAAYAFAAERQRQTTAAPLPAPHSHTRLQTRRLDVHAHIPAAALPPLAPGHCWALGLSAVLQAADGSLSYWALHHPATAPDFHHPAARCQRLTPTLA